MMYNVKTTEFDLRARFSREEHPSLNLIQKKE